MRCWFTASNLNRPGILNYLDRVLGLYTGNGSELDAQNVLDLARCQEYE